MEGEGAAWLGVLVAILGGAVRASTPFLFVSLGECLTERSGRINLGLEGVLVMGAMSGYGISYFSGSPWLGVLAAGGAGALLALVHGLVCSLARVNDIAVGIALMLFGIGIAFFLGKPFIQPSAPQLQAIPLGAWADNPQIRAALRLNGLFVVGLVLTPLIAFFLWRTRWGMMLRTVGESEDAAAALGLPIRRIRILTTTFGGFLAGIGGSFLSLYYPGSWNEGLSSGQGLMAVALVIFARWDPWRCLMAALLFGGAGALGPALQSVGVTQGYYLFNSVPYLFTLAILVATSSRGRVAGMPGELSINR